MSDRPDQPTAEDTATALRQGSQAVDLLHAGKTEEACDLLQRAVNLLPDHPGLLLNLGGAYVLLGRWNDARRTLTHACEVNPDDPMAWSNLGAALLRVPELSGKEQQEGAITAFKRALELDPRARNVAYHLGLVHRLRYDWAEAAAAFQLALEADPNDRDAASLLRQMQEKVAEGDSPVPEEAEPEP